MAMIENKTTETKPTDLDDTLKADETPAVADPSTPVVASDGAIELDDAQVQAISGGAAKDPKVFL
jgi:hypothetical protein